VLALLKYGLVALASLAVAIGIIALLVVLPPHRCTAQDMPGEYAASDALASRIIPGCPGPKSTESGVQARLKN
jgi:hypothetical protein